MTINIEMWPIGKIKPYEANAKIHDESQVKALAEVIKNQGWDVPIVVDEKGCIIKGHGRRLAALSLKMKEVPVICRKDMTPEQIRAARLSDNRVALGDFDNDLLERELREMNDLGFDINNIGFSEKELDFLTGDIMNQDENVFDDVPDLDENEDGEGEVGTGDVSIGNAFGFTRVPQEHRRSIQHFMALIEKSTGEEGSAAINLWVKSALTKGTLA